MTYDIRIRIERLDNGWVLEYDGYNLSKYLYFQKFGDLKEKLERTVIEDIMDLWEEDFEDNPEDQEDFEDGDG